LDFETSFDEQRQQRAVEVTEIVSRRADEVHAWHWSKPDTNDLRMLNDTVPAGRGVVGVLGEAHLPGVQQLWQSGGWKPLLARVEGDSDTDSQLSDATTFSEGGAGAGTPSPALAPHEEAGVRHALLESVIRQKSVASAHSLAFANSGGNA